MMSELSVYIIPSEDSPNVWGMSLSARLQKQLLKIERELHFIADFTVLKGKSCLILRGDCVYDQAVLDGLCGDERIALLDAEDKALAVHAEIDEAGDAYEAMQGGSFDADHYKIVTPETINSGYRDALRKKEAPYVLPVTQENVRAIEWRLYQGSYKGVTDLVTKYLWPVPAFHVTRLCAFLKLSPNMVTSVGAALMLYALYAFAQGDYALGLLAGWIMTFLDTVDGKLARVTLTSSKWGNIFDHGIDLIHPPFWYVAWIYGLSHVGLGVSASWVMPLIGLIFAFYILGRLCEGYFIARFGVHIHVWRKIDSWFRLISSRRNPNMIVLTLSVFLGRPDMGLYIIIGWGVLTFAIHLVQIAQAELSNRKTALVSWLKT